MNKWLFTVSVTGMAAFAALSPQLALAQSAKPWVIGHVAPLTGPAATVGRRTDRSTQLWVEEVNAAGGIRGRKIELINCNDENRPERAVACARDMIDRGAVVIIGNALTASIRAIQPLVRQGPILIIGSPNVVPSAESFGFQVSPSDEHITEAVAKYMKENGLSKIGMVAATDASGEVGVQSAKKVFPRHNINLKIERIDLRATDASTQLASVASQDVPIVYSSYTGGGAFTVVRSFRTLGLTQPLVVSYGNISDAFVELVKDVKPSRLLGTSLAGLVPEVMKDQAEQARARRFLEAYSKRYAERADMLNIIGKIGTDTVDAILRKSPNPEDFASVKRWLEATTIESVHDQRFSPGNHVGVEATSVVIVELKDNRWVPASPVR